MHRLFQILSMTILLTVLTLKGGSQAPPILGQDKEKKNKGSPPRALFCIPLAVETNKTNKLVVRGNGLENLTEIIVHEPKCSGKLLNKGKKVGLPNNQMKAELVGDSEAEVELTLPIDFVGGTVAFSLVNANGEGQRAVCLVKDHSIVVAEKEPNDGFKLAQRLELDQVVEGSISRNQDVDVYQISLSGNKTYLFTIHALRAGSPLDPLLTLFDGEGRIIHMGEPPKPNQDPVIRYKPQKDTLVYVSIQDAHDLGANFFLYRLNVILEK